VFLNYAQHGVMDAPTDVDGEPESPFEEAVSDRLKKDGYDVVHQVGSGRTRA
jgi:hypothetical protein